MAVNPASGQHSVMRRNADGSIGSRISTSDIEGLPDALDGYLPSILPALANLAALKALTGDSLTDKALVHVETLGLYRYDTGSAATADDDYVVTPTSVGGGSGRFLKMAPPDIKTVLDAKAPVLMGSDKVFLATAPGADASSGDVNALVTSKHASFTPQAGDVVFGAQTTDGTVLTMVTDIAVALVSSTGIKVTIKQAAGDLSTKTLLLHIRKTQ